MRPFIYALMTLLIAPSLMAAEQVPFGDAVSEKVYNYHRHTPVIATSGKLKPGAVEEVKAHGFKTVLDLRTAGEGVAAEAQAFAEVGLVYHNLPVNRDWPEAAVFEQFKILIENKDNYPLLIHCGSANRVGMLWAAYQLSNGVEYEAAMLEGRTIGMRPAREKQLKQNLSLLRD